MNFNSLFVSLLLVSCSWTATVFAAKKKATAAVITSTQKLEALIKKIELSHVVSLSDGNFSKFITERPRDYTAFLMFTATAKQYQCSVCLRAKTNLEDVAEYYHQQFNFNLSAPSDRIAFFRVEVDDARNTFNEMQLETVPRVYILPPTTVDSPKMKLVDFEIESRYLLESAAATLAEIYALTGVKITVTISPEPLLLILCFSAVLLALFVSAASHNVLDALLWYQSPKIWVVVSVVCFGVGVSGSIFCIIRSAQPYGMTRAGLVLFAPQGRDQYLIEGIVVALWTVGCGLSYTVMLAATKIRFPVLRHVLVLLSMTLFIVLILQIWHAYIDKTGWYALRDTFPAEVWAWLTGAVRKNSTLFKRLLRMSEYWLFESKDWSSFVKKFNSLVVEYLRRQMISTDK